MGDRYVVIAKTTKNGKPWMRIVANVESKKYAEELARDYDGKAIVRKVGKRKKKSKKKRSRRRK